MGHPRSCQGEKPSRNWRVLSPCKEQIVVCREILDIHQYPPGVSRLLGEFLAAAVLLSTNLKFEGKLILQVRSQGQVPLLMVECDHTLQVRGIAQGAEHATSNSNDQLLEDGQLGEELSSCHNENVLI